MSRRPRTHYEILEVDRKASPEVISAAYHELAPKYHPDVNHAADATERMQEINIAYETLSDPERRAAYDAELAANEPGYVWVAADGKVWKVWPADDELAASVKRSSSARGVSSRQQYHASAQAKVHYPQSNRSPAQTKSRSQTWFAVLAVAVLIPTLLWAVGRRLDHAATTPESSPKRGQPIASLRANAAMGVPNPDSPAWASKELAGGTLHLECPSEWTVDVDTASEIGVSHANQTFKLVWSENRTGRDIGSVIDLSESDPDFGQRYKESFAAQFQVTLEQQGSSLLGISAPRTETIGPHQALYIQAALAPPATSPLDQLSLLHFVFDCGGYACQAQAYKAGSQPLTLEEWRTVKRMIASIAFAE